MYLCMHEMDACMYARNSHFPQPINKQRQRAWHSSALFLKKKISTASSFSPSLRLHRFFFFFFCKVAFTLLQTRHHPFRFSLSSPFFFPYLSLARRSRLHREYRIAREVTPTILQTTTRTAATVITGTAAATASSSSSVDGTHV